jgi:hypothetical protein
MLVIYEYEHVLSGACSLCCLLADASVFRASEYNPKAVGMSVHSREYVAGDICLLMMMFDAVSLDEVWQHPT